MSVSLYSRTRGILERHQLRAKKGLSQHFLVDDEVFSRIVETARTHPQILEVGAGLGLLTEALARETERLITLEVDRKLCQILLERLASFPNVEIRCESVLEFKPDLHFGGTRFAGVGNLPYHLSGAILRWFLEQRAHFSNLYLMLQKEVAERIAARPGSKAYGVLSLLCQYFTRPALLFTVPASAFFPPPQVESAFIQLTPISRNVNPRFVPLVKRAFRERRKTIYNNLKSWNVMEAPGWNTLLESAGINPKARAEAVPLEAYEKLAGLL